MPRGVARFEAPVFGLDEAREILALITDGHRQEADDALRHYVHVGVPPSVLFEVAMALQRQHDEEP
jgi:hypothetical protein